MAAKKTESLSFDAALGELEQIVQQLEQGDLPLETALKQFERGIQLARVSKQKLEQAEQQVQILLQQGEQEKLTPFTVEQTSGQNAEEE
ncbi:exodeoxyribonuclease VII, small subunit [Tolumonas auensis DSM 9187]|uniref:Exodeoxyribonuclease 7 small subunit n=1 Tax=Tolumonas auensis (strain DSM 9187 / NBRC 110442 / TA 4) TaxID=595494 RepID=EX7S_TOLAT|nr:exodeoxyribonuclease VII small subunit [Tolumonas auensis]C4LAC2.1 RecName: Full=Exodeoxyribonuclease 7 small subunit; AltName: Full=Exodeoxyribonuclease VII small subunit; Short=Exonuclease VII small subunit [Tolumonas auensis DSM 9187]ACQ94097.1 exodeoxyribonuclease VII, small subunit [Tolumonas auensis DSM 9187]